MKKTVYILVIFILSFISQRAFAYCDNKPGYIPKNYGIVSCGIYSGFYLESYVVKDSKTGKYGAYTYWREPDNPSSTIMNPIAKYNKMTAEAVYDEIEPVKDGFIVKKNGKYGYIHVDKGMLFDVIYDKIYLSDDRKKVYAKSGSDVKGKSNPDNLADRLDDAMFNIFIRPLFFWLDDALPSR